MKKIAILALCVSLFQGINAQTISQGDWQIMLNPDTRKLTIRQNGTSRLDEAFAVATYNTPDGTTTEARSYDATQAETLPAIPENNAFGQGCTYGYRYTMADGTQLLQTFSFYEDLPYFLTRLSIVGKDGQISSNYLAPLTNESSTVLASSGVWRILFVPWDNDGFVWWQSVGLSGRTMNSYATTAIYDPTSRNGMVAGAVDHDVWKNAIHAVGSNARTLSNFALISGYTDQYSHDDYTDAAGKNQVMPHGKVTADTVRSARFMFGYYADYRTGMEDFANACTRVAPAREYDASTPVGWNSWGVMQTKVSLQGALDVANFIKDNLRDHGFHDNKGQVVISLDSWWNDNFSAADIKTFVDYCKANNMIPGLYYGPFCYWGGNPDNSVPGTNGKYKFRDIMLTVNGEFKKLDGAYCLDPTHPATKMYMMNDIKMFANYGISYLKCDFMSQGAIEADSWYDKNITTGIQAYNYGMDWMVKQIERFFGSKDAVFINLSISPLFPYQYAHGRRMACDTWGTIGQTKYMLNSMSYGWWEQALYKSLDPDHLVLHLEGGNAKEREGVNRARLTSGAITGAYLLGDNFSDNVSAGYPQQSRERALQLVTNEEVNEIVRTCMAFRPVEGLGGTGNNTENLFLGENDHYYYLAVINYGENVFSAAVDGTISYERLGIDPQNCGEIKELWSGKTVTPTTAGIPYSVSYSDAAIIRITKKNVTAIKPVAQAAGLQVSRHGSLLSVSASSPIHQLSLCNATGMTVSSSKAQARTGSLPVGHLSAGVYILTATLKDSTREVFKIKL